MDGEIRGGIRRLFALAFRSRARAHAELDEEIRFHLEARVEQLVAGGLSPQAARLAALGTPFSSQSEPPERRGP